MARPRIDDVWLQEIRRIRANEGASWLALEAWTPDGEEALAAASASVADWIRPSSFTFEETNSSLHELRTFVAARQVEVLNPDGSVSEVEPVDVASNEWREVERQ
jgi:hypothetical protein